MKYFAIITVIILIGLTACSLDNLNIGEKLASLNGTMSWGRYSLAIKYSGEFREPQRGSGLYSFTIEEDEKSTFESEKSKLIDEFKIENISDDGTIDTYIFSNCKIVDIEHNALGKTVTIRFDKFKNESGINF